MRIPTLIAPTILLLCALANAATNSAKQGIYALRTGELENQNRDRMKYMDHCRESDTILPGDALKGCTEDMCLDQSKMLVSTNNANKVAIHTSGEMCVYGTRNGVYGNTWCAGRSLDASRGPFYGKLHDDGNFCLYTKSGSNYYCTSATSTGNGGYRMVMQNDGNLVIYNDDDNVIWSSGTAHGWTPFPYCGEDHLDGNDGCSGGEPGSGYGKGGEGACCKTQRDCRGCCTAGRCNAACD